jgi:hypothetical protein
MKVHEPMTFATDCGLAAWCAWLGYLLSSGAPSLHPEIINWWIGGFAATAIAAAAGAVHHGLGHALAPAVNRACWRLALLSLVATGRCLAQVAVLTAFSGNALDNATLVCWCVAAFLVVAAMRTDRFAAAICAYGLGEVALLVAAFAMRAHHPPGHLAWIAAAFVASVIAVAVQRSQRGFGQRFNHNDIYHVIQAAALGFFYLAATA